MTDQIALAPVSLPDFPKDEAPPPEGFSWRAADFGNAIDAADKAYQFDQDIYARRNALSDAIDRRNKDIERATGVTLENPWNGGYEAEARERLFKSGKPGTIWDAREQIWSEKLGELQTQYPDHADKIGADRPILDDAKQLANYWSDRAAKGAPGLGATANLAANLLGGMRGFLRSPMNWALLPIGGGEVKAVSVAGKIGEAFLREGAANAAMQAAAEPFVQAWRGERGQENGLGAALEDIGMAGLFGGVFGAGAQGGRIALSRGASASGPAQPAEALRAALEADRAALADPPPAKGLDLTLSQALDHAEGASDALPEMPAIISAASDEAEKINALADLDPGPAHDAFDLAARLRADPDLSSLAQAHDAPDLAAAGRLASLNDAAFEAARNGEIETHVALATAARVPSDADQLGVMRAAQSERPRTLDEAAEAVSREMQARALPHAQAAALEAPTPLSRVPDAPGFDRVGQRLTEHTAALERELIAKPPAADAPEIVVDVKPKRAVSRRFPSLFEALAGEGGLAPNPELAAIFNGNPFVPGFGRLIRQGGRSLDQALAAAKELGYLFDPADAEGAGELKIAINDLLDLLRQEAHGAKVYTSADLQEMAAQAAAREGKQWARAVEKAKKRLVKDPAVDIDENWPPDVEIRDKAAMMMAEDETLAPADAWGRAFEDYRREAQARAEQFAELQKARQDETGSIPDWDEFENDPVFGAAAVDAANAPQPGGAGARAGGGKAGEGGGAGADRAGTGTDRGASGEAPTAQIAVDRGDGAVEFVPREKLMADNQGEQIAGLIEGCGD